METSIRYGGESSALRLMVNDDNTPPPPTSGGGELKIHAKQKLQIDSTTLLQLSGELDTRSGTPTFLSALFTHFYPHLSASLGAGLHYDTNNKLQCTMRAKKAYPVASTPFVNFVLKGRCNIDKDLNQPYEFKVGAPPGRERKRDFVDNPNGLFSAQAAPKPPPAMYSVVEGMKVGGKRTVIVPPEVGYGKKGLNEIPPGATFELNLELLQVTRPEGK